MDIEIVRADYRSQKHQVDLVALLDLYAADPMGGSRPLSAGVKLNLARSLAELPYAYSFLAYHEDTAVGLLNCFQGFSTFSCKPLINIHDVVVVDEYRGKGISKKLLAAVEALANRLGCCKLTLEVLSNNAIAKAAYKKFGFEDYELDASTGKALFWQKKLS